MKCAGYSALLTSNQTAATMPAPLILGRQMDSNQYWQLRAEIAGAEARVRTSLEDRKDEESKAEKRAEEKVVKLEKQVELVAQAQTQGTPAQ